MHIGLNLVYLVPGDTGGTETYAQELIPELVAAAPDARFTAFVNREAAGQTGRPWGELVPAVTVPVNARNRAQWVRGEQQLLPRLAATAGVDLLHSLANTAPAWGGYRRVVTIHDLAYRLAPEAHLGMLGMGMRVLVPLAAHRSNRIIVDASSTRDDVRRFLKVSPDKVDVVPLGLGSTPHPVIAPEHELRERLGAGDRPIVLCVAAMRPHKNLCSARARGSADPGRTDARCWCSPAIRRAHGQELRRLAGELGVAGDVRFPGWVDASELEGLYAAAACFVFPSLIEGFGLPVLEAMARGVPVACSGRGSLSEVAGNAALLFDPESEPAIAAVIERLLRDRAEADRLAAAGRERARRFTWAATAAGTLAGYRKAVGRPGLFSARGN